MLPGVTAMPACRVLVADDHSGVNAAIRRLLVANNYEVVGGVEDGALVLDEAARLQPDVILLDLYMPNMDGIDVCRELTRLLPRTRVIVTTGGDPVVAPAVLAAGAFAFVDKWALNTALLPAVRLACDGVATESLT